MKFCLKKGGGRVFCVCRVLGSTFCGRYQSPGGKLENTLTVADRMQRHCQATHLTEVWRACSHLCLKRERAPTNNRQCLRSSLRALRFFFSAVVRNGNRHTVGSECPPQRSKASHKRIMPPPRVGDGQKLQSGLGSFPT